MSESEGFFNGYLNGNIRSERSSVLLDSLIVLSVLQEYSEQLLKRELSSLYESVSNFTWSPLQ